MTRRSIVIVAALLLVVPAVPAAERLADDPRVASAIRLLETWVEGQRLYENIPGISGALVHDQELVWSHGFGLSDRDAGSPATPETIYSICSISKLFTGIAVMQQRDAGKLALSDAVGDRLPWFDIEQAHPEGPPATVWGLLTHSSGLPRESDFPYWNLPDFPFPTREEMMGRLEKQRTLYPAATYYQYSNLGLTLLGEIVAEVSGTPFPDHVRKQILDPLELDDTRPEMPEGKRGKRLATGYGGMTRRGTRDPVPPFQARAIAPAAGFSSTVEDLARFASWQFRVLEGTTDAVLARNTLREMQRVQWMDPAWEITRGLAFGVYRVRDTTFVGHSGSCPGYRSTLRLQTDDKFAAVFMTNAGGEVAPESWASRAHQIVQPAIEKALESDEPGKPTDPAFEKYAGSYDYAPWGGEAAVIPWKEGLAVISLPTSDPLEALEELRHVEGDTFRRVRKDGELGEEVVFEVDDSGRAIAVRRHSLRWPRIDDAR